MPGLILFTHFKSLMHMTFRVSPGMCPLLLHYCTSCVFPPRHHVAVQPPACSIPSSVQSQACGVHGRAYSCFPQRESPRREKKTLSCGFMLQSKSKSTSECPRSKCYAYCGFQQARQELRSQKSLPQNPRLRFTSKNFSRK